MKQKTKNIIAGILIIWIVIGILIGIRGNFEEFPFSTIGNYECSGGQELSISNAQIYTSTELGGKKAIRVTYSTLPSSECLYISLKPEDINSKLSDADKEKFRATNTVLGDIKLIKSQKVYNINERTGETFRNIGLDLLPGYNPLYYPCWDSLCNNHFLTTFASNMYTGSIWAGTYDKCVCSYDGSDLGVNGEFSSSTGYQWETQIDIGNENPLILNQNSQSGKIGSIAFVKWSGNLLSNDNLEAISGYQAYKPYSDNQYRMIDFGTYTRFKDKYATIRQGLIDCDSSWSWIFKNCNIAVETAYGYRSELEQNLIDKLPDWIRNNNLVESASILSNELIVNLKSPIVYPTFTLDIDASAVGIFITSGEPDVTCPTNIPTLVSGQTYDATINLKNIGSNSGSFDYSTSCNKGSQSLQPSPPQQIGSQVSKSIIARLGLTVEEGTDTSTCTFTARDINSLKSDSCIFSYTAEHQSDCIEGTKSCELGNTELWTCKSDGSYTKVKCQYGCSFENGEYKCEAKPDGNETEPCASCWNWLKDKLGIEQECKTGFIQKSKDALFCPFKFLKLALILISSLFALLFGQQFANKTFRNIPYWATWVIAILFSGLIGVLAYMFLEWYYVIPVLLVLFVFGIIINAIPGGKYMMGAIRRR